MAVRNGDEIIISLKDINLTRITSTVKYVCKGTFHQWRQNDQVYALKFQNEDTSSKWNTELGLLISEIKKGSQAKKIQKSSSIDRDAPLPPRRNVKSSESSLPSSSSVSVIKVDNVAPLKPPVPVRSGDDRSRASTRVSVNSNLGSLEEGKSVIRVSGAPVPPKAPTALQNGLPAAPKAPPAPQNGVPAAPKAPPAPQNRLASAPKVPQARSETTNLKAQPSSLLDSIKSAKMGKLKSTQQRNNAAVPVKSAPPPASNPLSMMEEMASRLKKRHQIVEQASSNIDDNSVKSNQSSLDKDSTKSDATPAPLYSKSPFMRNDMHTPTKASNPQKNFLRPTASGSVSREDFDKFKDEILNLIEKKFETLKMEIINELRK